MLRQLISYPKNIFRFIRPVHVHLKTDKVDLKKKPPRKFFFLHFFTIHSSSRHEKCCQMLERIFSLFQCSRNILWYPTFAFQSWKVKNLTTTSVYYNTPVVSEIGVHSTLLLHALNAQNKCIRFQSCHVIFCTFQGHIRIFQDFCGHLYYFFKQKIVQHHKECRSTYLLHLIHFDKKFGRFEDAEHFCCG